MRKDNRFRFTLQWGTDTQERSVAGEFLEKLGNKKSDFIVMAVWEYLQRHPEAMLPETRIKITSQPTFTKQQVLSEVKDMIRTYMEGVMPSVPGNGGTGGQESRSPEPSEDALNDMLDNLNVFEQ